MSNIDTWWFGFENDFNTTYRFRFAVCWPIFRFFILKIMILTFIDVFECSAFGLTFFHHFLPKFHINLSNNDHQIPKTTTTCMFYIWFNKIHAQNNFVNFIFMFCLNRSRKHVVQSINKQVGQAFGSASELFILFWWRKKNHKKKIESQAVNKAIKESESEKKRKTFQKRLEISTKI